MTTTKHAPGTKKLRCPNKYTAPGQYKTGKKILEARIDEDGNPYYVEIDEYADRLPDVP